jgi:2-polyprenyl-3-methyl-5-hydroxy-6-metoxy-1,4-benzoquinol methylase
VNAETKAPVSILRCTVPSTVVRRGETLHAVIEVANNTKEPQSVFAWFDVLSLEGKPLTPYPFFKPVALRLQGEETARQNAYVLVPYSAAPGKYLLCLALGSAPGARSDERSFEISVDLQRTRERNRCNLCGEPVEEDDLVWQDASIRLAECPVCGLVFDFDLEDEHSLSYQLAQVCRDGLTFAKNSPTLIEDYDRRNEIVLAAEIERIKDTIPPTGKRLLDFGCGTGDLLVQARRAGFEVVGVETSEDAAEFAKRVSELAVFSSVEALRGGQKGPFLDVIVARHTLEHVPNPMKTLREFRGLLRPEGLLVIIVPHFNFFARRVLPNAMPRFSYGLIHKGHQYYFTQKTLSRYLKEAGFCDTRFRYSLLGGFLSRWAGRPAASGSTLREGVFRAASKTLSGLMHLARVNPVLTVYAR